MDKIKILAAVLALAGCMENSMGMGVQEEDKYGNSTPENRLVITPENISQIDTFKKFTPYVFFENIDFTKGEIEQYWNQLSKITNLGHYIRFTNCIFDDHRMWTFPLCSEATSIEFNTCRGVNEHFNGVRISTSADTEVIYK